MLLGALIDCSEKKVGLDVGTGTGVLALMQAQKNSELQITAIEIDELSTTDAKQNIENGPFSSQIKLVHADFLHHKFDFKFDLIFSNPPFYNGALKSENQRTNQAKHVDELNADQLCKKASQLLEENGEFWLIWPYDSRKDIIDSALKNELHLRKDITIEGKPGIPVRSILCLTKLRDLPVLRSELTVRDEFGAYTDEYKKLTSDFHSKKL